MTTLDIVKEMLNSDLPFEQWVEKLNNLCGVEARLSERENG